MGRLGPLLLFVALTLSGCGGPNVPAVYRLDCSHGPTCTPVMPH